MAGSTSAMIRTGKSPSSDGSRSTGSSTTESLAPRSRSCRTSKPGRQLLNWPSVQLTDIGSVMQGLRAAARLVHNELNALSPKLLQGLRAAARLVHNELNALSPKLHNELNALSPKLTEIPKLSN